MRNTAPETVAAVDLGSNSFHMIVCELKGGELHTIDRLREMVRLAAGIDESRKLSKEAQTRALECLERFGQRIRDLPLGSVRAVGTNTLRRAYNSEEFIRKASRALGHPIEVISGREEARLIYSGVSHSLASNGTRRLVMDIGGGSTEFIIGTGYTPGRKESLNVGCVSMSQAYFPDGKITAKRFNQAVLHARAELEPFQRGFIEDGWEEAIGASGTLRSVRKVLVAAGWSKDDITAEGLEKLANTVIEAGHIDKLQLPDLNPERAPVFPGGLAIICASFTALKLDNMKVSDGALREGLIYDLVGRISQKDTRENTIQAITERYLVDIKHSERIIKTLRYCLEQLNWYPSEEERDSYMQWLSWAAFTHEIGMVIAHSHYHRHSAYVMENADLAGFSQQDQKLVAALVKSHRRKFSCKAFRDLESPWDEIAPDMAILFRLAVLLHRSRQTDPLPEFRLTFSKKKIKLKFPDNWLEDQPLTRADLEIEAKYLKSADYQLEFS